MWIDRSFKKLKLFDIDDLESKIGDCILSKYGLKASYSSEADIVIFVDNFSDIVISIINNKTVRITLTKYGQIKEINDEIDFAKIKNKWTISHHDNFHDYEDVIDSIEDLINLEV